MLNLSRSCEEFVVGLISDMSNYGRDYAFYSVRIASFIYPNRIQRSDSLERPRNVKPKAPNTCNEITKKLPAAPIYNLQRGARPRETQLVTSLTFRTVELAWRHHMIGAMAFVLERGVTFSPSLILLTASIPWINFRNYALGEIFRRGNLLSGPVRLTGFI